MSVKIESTQNLVIGKTKQQLTSAIELTQNLFSVSFNLLSYSLYPSTHYTDGVYNLRYVSNTQAVDLSSGKARDNQQLQYQAVTSVDADKYFKDYVVYISSFGGQMMISSLVATLNSDILNQTLTSASIDFYVQGLYVATANLQDTQAIIINQDYLIPNSRDDAIQITMRSYFDGELSSNGRAYINTNQICLDDLQVQIGVVFTAY